MSYYDDLEAPYELYEKWTKGQKMAAPTLKECFSAGKGPDQADTFHEGGLSNTTEERARFEAYMRGHCWEVGNYDNAIRSYDTGLVRMLYGVWRDRGLLAAALPDDRVIVPKEPTEKMLRAALARKNYLPHNEANLFTYYTRIYKAMIAAIPETTT